MTKDIKDIELKFSKKTVKGDPMCWLELSDKTTIEIAYEEGYDGDRFYSVVHFCTKEDFEAGLYGDAGIIDSFGCDTLEEVRKVLQYPSMIGDAEVI